MNIGTSWSDVRGPRKAQLDLEESLRIVEKVRVLLPFLAVKSVAGGIPSLRSHPHCGVRHSLCPSLA